MIAVEKLNVDRRLIVQGASTIGRAEYALKDSYEHTQNVRRSTEKIWLAALTKTERKWISTSGIWQNIPALNIHV